jgi:hypothetical protein
MKHTFIAVAVCLLFAGCTKEPPTTVCLRSHEESYTDMVPVISGIYKGIPQYMYIPQDETREVCDEARPITASELADWHKQNDPT